MAHEPVEDTMQAGDVKLGKIFANDRHNVIPFFQRPYVWGEKRNWEPLWQDIRQAAEEVEAELEVDRYRLREPRTYFLGAIVVQDRRRQPRRLSSTSIIDGQQRLTTLQVLLAAARAVASGLGAETVAGRLKSLVKNRDETVEPDFPDDYYKIWPLPQDQKAYLWAVRDPDAGAAPPEPDHKLVQARVWFQREVAEWAAAAPDPASRLDHLYETVNDRMQVVQIVLDLADDPQVIFESLNFRGERLAAADLVKNLLFRRLDDHVDGAAAEDLLNKVWLPLDAKPWRQKKTTGRIKRDLVDLLLAYWLTIARREEVQVEHLFVDFKNWMSSGVDAADVIRDIRHYADTYLRLQHLPETDPTAQLLSRMESTTSTPYPVMLYLHAHEEVPQQQRDLAARAIDSYLVRRYACRKTTKDFNRLFTLVCTEAVEASPEIAGQVVVETLAAQTADSRYWPDDGQFLEGLMRKDLYSRLNATHLKTVLVGLENALRSSKAEPEPLFDSRESKLNIEHLIPQSWERNWPLRTSDDEHLAQRESALHGLGNLTLVTSEMNSSLSNGSWTTKRDALRKHSLCRLTTATVFTVPEGLSGWSTDEWTEVWDEERVALRGEWLGELALRVWPRPQKSAAASPPGAAPVVLTECIVEPKPNAVTTPPPADERRATDLSSRRRSAPGTRKETLERIRRAREERFPSGSRLIFDASELSSDRVARVDAWLNSKPERRFATLDWSEPRNYMRWAADGQLYSATGLTTHIVDQAISKGHLGAYNGAKPWHDQDGVYLTDVE